MSEIEAWLARLESFPWWDAPTEWVSFAYEKSWFIEPEDADGYFLVETKYDTYDVTPPDYDMSDSWYEEPWWLETGHEVQIHELGKWQFFYGLKEPHLPNGRSESPEEVWVLLQGGWSQSVTHKPSGSRLARIEEIVRRAAEPENFRGYLAKSIGLSEYDLWGLADLLQGRNLGFALVPNHGILETYEMATLEAATADPKVVMNKFSPSHDLHNVGVGLKEIRVGDRRGYEPVNEIWYNQTLEVINRPLRSANQLSDAFTLAIGPERVPEWIRAFGGAAFMRKRDPLKHLRIYLASPEGQQHFAMLDEAGYAVALIPIGGRTFWRP